MRGADCRQTVGMARRRTAEEIQKIVEELQASGLSHRDFCQQTGIKLSTLGRYARRARGSEQPQQLVRVKLDVPQEPGAGFVLMLGNGRRIASGWGFSDTALARLIRVAESA
jgi:5-formyltetrahydrofolate cyclo-ligase